VDGGKPLIARGMQFASRIIAAAETSEILTSRTVRDLMTGSEIAFDERRVA
jgi:hypothetical protein